MIKSQNEIEQDIDGPYNEDQFAIKNNIFKRIRAANNSEWESYRQTSNYETYSKKLNERGVSNNTITNTRANTNDRAGQMTQVMNDREKKGS